MANLSKSIFFLIIFLCSCSRTNIYLDFENKTVKSRDGRIYTVVVKEYKNKYLTEGEESAIYYDLNALNKLKKRTVYDDIYDHYSHNQDNLHDSLSTVYGRVSYSRKLDLINDSEIRFSQFIKSDSIQDEKIGISQILKPEKYYVIEIETVNSSNTVVSHGKNKFTHFWLVLKLNDVGDIIRIEEYHKKIYVEKPIRRI